MLPSNGWYSYCIEIRNLMDRPSWRSSQAQVAGEAFPGVPFMNDDRGVFEDSPQIEGRYANYFKVGHNAFEFVLDFGQFYAGSEQAQLHTRIITSPAYAMALLRTLKESLERYEETFGPMRDQEG